MPPLEATAASVAASGVPPAQIRDRSAYGTWYVHDPAHCESVVLAKREPISQFVSRALAGRNTRRFEQVRHEASAQDRTGRASARF